MADLARIQSCEVYILPVQARIPYRFGAATMGHVDFMRVKLTVSGSNGRTAVGWGETPLNAGWAWPGSLPAATRDDLLKRFAIDIASTWVNQPLHGHALEAGYHFLEHMLDRLRTEFSAAQADMLAGQEMPMLAALVASSAYDLALHDAYGNLNGCGVFDSLTADYLKSDLASYYDSSIFRGKFPADYLRHPPLQHVTAWHSVGAGDALDPQDLTGHEPQDDHPVLLRDWIRRDGITHVKIKLRGDDPEWDYRRWKRIGEIGRECGVRAYCADFNCTARDLDTVVQTLQRLKREAPDLYDQLLYVEQPFQHEVQHWPADVRPISSLKPLYMDESAHDWRLVRQGLSTGWTGVALKACKTLTGAILMLCWAREHGMQIMVQDLSNAMLAQIAHASLAAHVPTIAGLESNGMQYYPAASRCEAAIHPGLYRRREGKLDLSTLGRTGFGYRVDDIQRELPRPELVVGSV